MIICYYKITIYGSLPLFYDYFLLFGIILLWHVSVVRINVVAVFSLFLIIYDY